MRVDHFSHQVSAVKVSLDPKVLRPCYTILRIECTFLHLTPPVSGVLPDVQQF